MKQGADVSIANGKVATLASLSLDYQALFFAIRVA